MDILTLVRDLKEAADLVVADEEGRALLFIEVRPNIAFEGEYLARFHADRRKFEFPFAMFVTADSIKLFGPDQADEAVAQFDTAETLLPHSPQFDGRRHRSRADLAHHLWSWLATSVATHPLEEPTHLCCLERIGLAGRLRGGEVMTMDQLFRKYAEVGCCW